MTTPTDAQYAGLGRELADALIRFARDRRTEDQKDIGWLQHELCRLRREELAEQTEQPSA